MKRATQMNPIAAYSFLVKPSSIEGLIAIGRTLRDWIGCSRLPRL